MIGYVTLGSNDIARAARFYDELLAVLGAKRAIETEKFIAWSNGQGAMLAVIKPHDGKPATVGNGVMVSLAAGGTAMVDRIYARAIELGARDEGPAGPRGNGFYGGYFRDMDGNKLCAFHMGS